LRLYVCWLSVSSLELLPSHGLYRAPLDSRELLRGHHKRKEQEGKERAVQGGNGWYNASVRGREKKKGERPLIQRAGRQEEGEPGVERKGKREVGKRERGKSGGADGLWGRKREIRMKTKKSIKLIGKKERSKEQGGELVGWVAS
jgi:hypothetical protein